MEGEGKTLQEMLEGLRPRVVESWRARSQANGKRQVEELESSDDKEEKEAADGSEAGKEDGEAE